jgi:hypothetical protein
MTPKNLTHSFLPILKQHKGSLFNLSLITGVIVLVNLLAIAQGYCVTDDDFAEEIEKANKLITGGYMHLGLMAMCGFGGIVCILEKKLTGAIICAAATLFVYMMKDWITTNFAAVI